MWIPALVCAALAAGATPAGERVVVVANTGVCTVVPAADVTDEILQDANHVWTWSDSRAPRAVAPEWLRTAGKAEADDRLKVRVLIPEGETDPGLTVVAGPVVMWQEVPEDLMPTWPVPESGVASVPRERGVPWRVRLRGQGVGSCWIDVPARRTSLTLTPRGAPDVSLKIGDARGNPVYPATLRLFREARGRPGLGALVASFRNQPSGRVRVEGLPGCESLLAVVMAENFAPTVIRDTTPTLPPEVVLDRGAQVIGRLVDAEGTPVAQAEVSVSYWAAPDLLWQITRPATSAADGSWRVSAVPRGGISVEVRAERFVPHRARHTVAGDALDLGAIPLEPGLAVPVHVVNDAGSPVENATLTTRGTVVCATDPRGDAVLTAVSPTAVLELTAAADGHLDSEISLRPPIPELLRIELVRALSVTGRVVDEDGAPLADVTVRAEVGSSFRSSQVPADGRLDLALRPDEETLLKVSSPGSQEVRVEVAKGAPGERRDLGDIVVPRGIVATGRVMSGADGAPIAGASVWSPRFTPAGVLVAWMTRDLLETDTGSDGTFTLGGLGGGERLLRIDRPGYARAYVPLEPDDERGCHELGDIELHKGATITVTCDDRPCEGATARVDLRGEWLELDMLYGVVCDGAARVEHVAEGPVTVSVIDRETLLCEREVTVSHGDTEIEVPCERSTTTVYGSVLVSGYPSGAGVLTWSTPGAGTQAAIMTHTASSGLQQQGVFRGGRPPVSVDVADDGTFVTDAVAPGEWTVAWFAGAGAPSPPKLVQIPDVEEYDLVLEYPGAGITGVVIDEEGNPVTGARVKESTTGAFALAAEDGTFRLLGLSPGSYRLQAFDRGERSTVVTVVVREDEPPDPVQLVIGDDETAKVVVTVAGPEGDPRAGAIVFLEVEPGALRMFSTGPGGSGDTDFYPPYPQRVRAAASVGGSWILGPWRPFDEARDGLTLTVGEAGALTITSDEAAGVISIFSPGGWDVSRLLTRLAFLPAVRPGSPVHIGGLPAGQYRLQLGAFTQSAWVRPGETTEIELAD